MQIGPRMRRAKATLRFSTARVVARRIEACFDHGLHAVRSPRQRKRRLMPAAWRIREHLAAVCGDANGVLELG